MMLILFHKLLTDKTLQTKKNRLENEIDFLSYLIYKVIFIFDFKNENKDVNKI